MQAFFALHLRTHRKRERKRMTMLCLSIDEYRTNSFLCAYVEEEKYLHVRARNFIIVCRASIFREPHPQFDISIFYSILFSGQTDETFDVKRGPFVPCLGTRFVGQRFWHSINHVRHIIIDADSLSSPSMRNYESPSGNATEIYPNPLSPRS